MIIYDDITDKKCQEIFIKKNRGCVGNDNNCNKDQTTSTINYMTKEIFKLVLY
jgi:hypothetical protein